MSDLKSDPPGKCSEFPFIYCGGCTGTHRMPDEGTTECPVCSSTEVSGTHSLSRDVCATPCKPGLTIGQLVAEAHGTAKKSGWHDDSDPKSPVQVLAWLALVHSEVSEAVEDVRLGNLEPGHDVVGSGPSKPTGLPSELADVLIRIADMAGAMGIDIEAAVRLKLAFNKTRSHRHGGKLV